MEAGMGTAMETGMGRVPIGSLGAEYSPWCRGDSSGPCCHGARVRGCPVSPAVVTATRGPRAAPAALQERTLLVAKPDAVQRRLLGDIIQRFERRGFKLVAMKLLQADRRLVEQHYEQLRLKPFYPALVAYMTSAPVVAMVWEGYNVVRCTRAMVGDSSAVGTIRGDLSVHITRNLVHASDSAETAQREIGFWFQRDELVAWDSRDRDNIYGL
ncbi:nucleoside diphosphate kinase, mitochondrial isoform X2 [Onychostruthus taczanowskii]|uniref:nucleoside diphosphate kinase, mitochondrial isoform X2 n=1 Tax=Onychostruthus taczanowskii TaxID=356909 RepID=UPI001B80CDFD|nr:nucleoside diphosphate kinase, mitochondrial isoform X2 [Onychostruthus taczanowskii]